MFHGCSRSAKCRNFWLPHLLLSARSRTRTTRLLRLGFRGSCSLNLTTVSPSAPSSSAESVSMHMSRSSLTIRAATELLPRGPRNITQEYIFINQSITNRFIKRSLTVKILAHTLVLLISSNNDLTENFIHLFH